LKTVLKIAAVAAAILYLAEAVKPKTKVSGYGIGQRWKISITGAKSGDLAHIIQTVALYCPNIGQADPSDDDGGEGAG
jgi:hypothetical protein